MATLKSQPGVCVHATVVTDLGLFKSIEIDSIEWIERHFRSPRSIKSVSTQVDARSEENNAEEENKGIQSLVKTRRLPIAIVDIATCDGPVLFDRVLNPNFAVTVEHHPSSTSTTKSPGSSPDRSPSSSDRKTVTSPRTNTYLCICCNQSFKSMFCYQKHKKRHLNPVTVDITSTTKNLPLVTVSDNKAYTKDLNVQFFPCKKCGCKFPSYYFVHKHKKVCHQVCI